MFQNKKYQKSLLALLLITPMVGFLITPGQGSKTGSPDHIPDSSTAINTNPENTDTGNESAISSIKNTESPTNSKPIFPQSPTTQALPDAPQIPYYLMATTNDPLLISSWALTTIQADRGWDLSTGSTATTVAVIDTGFELNHEDLAGRWFINTKEQGQTQAGDNCWTGTPNDRSTNNCDDDQNGYIDDWRGYDFFYGDNNPQAGQVNPSGEGVHHGTLVAGVVGATANNNKGSAGIDQSAKILPLQVFSDDSEAYTNSLVAAIDYATDMKANVINLSLGSSQPDNALLAAINRARSNGSLVIAASGNCALNDEPICNNLTAPGRMTYPALYDQVIAVGATDQNNQRADFSSYGPKLDIVAPGKSIGPLPVYSSNGTNYYATASGTSFAAPLVAGAASLLISQNPTATLQQIEELLTQSAQKVAYPLSQSFSHEYGYGLLNAHQATLLGLAKTQDNLLGTDLDSPRLPARGNVWRSATGNINNNESVLIGCRVFASDHCTLNIENGSVYRFGNLSTDKIGPLQYFFVKGSSIPSGQWRISVHNSEYATTVATLVK